MKFHFLLKNKNSISVVKNTCSHRNIFLLKLNLITTISSLLLSLKIKYPNLIYVILVTYFFVSRNTLFWFLFLSLLSYTEILLWWCPRSMASLSNLCMCFTVAEFQRYPFSSLPLWVLEKPLVGPTFTPLQTHFHPNACNFWTPLQLVFNVLLVPNL